MDGIILGHDLNSNAVIVYNPRNKNFYCPESYRIDPQRQPGLVDSNIKYDGGLLCNLYRDESPSQDEAYPPSTRVEQTNPLTHILRSGTVEDISVVTSQPDESKCYLVQFDNSFTKFLPVSEMPFITIQLPVMINGDKQDTLLPAFLQVGNRITYNHDGQF